MTSLLSTAVKALKYADVDSATLDARLLLEAATGMSREKLLLTNDDNITQPQKDIFNQFIARRVNREPVSKIIGRKDFWKDTFLTDTNVLDPRPDSETLVELTIDLLYEKAVPIQILDIGTGSGCLILSLLREFHNATGYGTDISEAALQVAKKNAHKLQLKERVTFGRHEWTAGINTKYDLIISNPPYIPLNNRAMLGDDVIKYDPHGALFAGDDGLEAYCQLIPQLPNIMKDGAIAIIELGIGQVNEIVDLGLKAGLKKIEIRKDLAGIERAIALQKL